MSIEIPAHMPENIHTHTARCHHATGTEREYIEAAIARGMRVLGFADHAPQFYPTDYVSGVRMLPEELPGYVETLSRLREEYRDRIEIRIGLELEYYPDCFEKTLDWIRRCGVEYLILGQHWTGNEIGERHTFDATDDEARLSLYVEQSLAGLRTGVFTYVAHPDGFHFTGDDGVYRRYMEHYCREARAMDIPLEINLQGLSQRRAYPDLRFWRIAAEVGCRIVLGCDAHQPEAMRDEQPYREGIDYCRMLGVTPEEHFTLRAIGG